MRSDVEGTLPNCLGKPNAACRSRFGVGGVSVQVAGARDVDVTLAPSLDPFRIQPGCPVISDIKIQVDWVEKLAYAPGCVLFDSGAVWRLFEQEAGFRFEFSTPTLGKDPYKCLIVDDEFRYASLLLSQQSFRDRDSAVPLEYPLDEVLITHRLAREKGIELHGCGIVGPKESANLFVGHSGAGKSTMARLWTACECVEVLSDDRIIVRRGNRGSTEEVSCESAGAVEHKGILRLRDCSASRISHFAQDDSETKSDDKISMYGTPWHGEAAFASPNCAPLERILILEHGYRNVLTPLSPSQAVAELFARSFVPFHRHEYLESALAFLQDVVDAVPVYRYAFEPGLPAVDTILNLHD